MKAMVLSTPGRLIRYVSWCWIGKAHDYGVFKEEFPPEQPWFENFRVRLDLGFVGFENDDVCKEPVLPHKRKKNQELDAEQKAENGVRAGGRISVEHAIGGLKRYRILSDRLRVHNIALYNTILGVCAGLWNFYLTH